MNPNINKKIVDGESLVESLSIERADREIVVAYDSTADLNGYINAEIPNELTITSNGNPATSTEVLIHPDIPTEVTKEIVTVDDYINYLRIENIAQTITYHGTATISNAETLTSVVISDTLQDLLSYVNGSFVVYDAKGNDISDKGYVTVDGQKVSFTFYEDYLINLAGHDITWDLKVTFDPLADLSGYINCEVPNVFIINVNDNPTTSEEVIIVPDIETEIEKEIVTEDGYVDYLRISNETQVITYHGTATVSNGEELINVVISDTLEDPLTYVDSSFVVYDSKGNDITDKGTVSVDGQTISFAFDKDYLIYLAGHSITWELQAEFDSTADLSSYINCDVPNEFTITVNDNPTISEEVIIVPDIPTEVAKEIVTENAYVDYLRMSNENQM